VDGRPLKLFVFSRLSPLHLGEDRRFHPEGQEVRFFLASPLPGLLEAFLRPLQETGELVLYGRPWPLRLLEPLPLPEPQDFLQVKALSPITVYRTVGRETHYLSPEDPDFSPLLEANLNRKAKALHLPPGRVRVVPLGGNTSRMERYKGFWVKGWIGQFALLGDPHLLHLALTAGLGAKNPQGFGFVRESQRRSSKSYIPGPW
jgi:CRISPR-associated endoribonuclease Cas6